MNDWQEERRRRDRALRDEVKGASALPGGEPFPAGIQIIGRGSRLHFRTGSSWYQLGIGDIPA
jgi:hypothetical protein